MQKRTISSQTQCGVLDLRGLRSVHSFSGHHKKKDGLFSLVIFQLGGHFHSKSVNFFFFQISVSICTTVALGSDDLPASLTLSRIECLTCLLCLPYHIACPIIICLLSTLLLLIIGPNMRNRLNLPENGHSISLSILEAFIFTRRTATISSWGGFSSSLSWDDCLPVTLVYMILMAEFGTF